MIKANLLNSKVPLGSAEAGQEYVFDSKSIEGNGQKEQLTKFGLMIFFTLCLVGYEYYNIGQLEGVRNKKNKALQALTNELNGLKAQIGDSEKVKKEIDVMNEKVALIQGLSKKRLKELKALDYLQSIIPDGIWLDLFDYDGTKARISGTSMTDRDLTSFVESLEQSVYFEDVQLVSALKDESRSGTFKKFEMGCVIGEVQ